MSEGAVQEVGAMGPTAGMLLRQAREAAGMHIAALAVALKVPVGKLEALESDNHAALPDAVFARALASSVCRTLKIDSGAILERLPQGLPPRLTTDSAGLNAAFKDPHAKAAAPMGASPGSRNAVLAVLALLIAAAVVYFMPRGALDSLHSTASPAAESAAAPAPVAEPVPAAEPEPVQAAQAPASQPAPAASAAVVSAAPVAVPMASVPPAQAPVAQASAAAMAAAPAGIVEFRASAESWVQVRDASGAVTFERSLKSGEAASAPGKPPLSVVVGKANATEVFVRGAPFDLASVARENVARFEVK